MIMIMRTSTVLPKKRSESREALIKQDKSVGHRRMVSVRWVYGKEEGR